MFMKNFYNLCVIELIAIDYSMIMKFIREINKYATVLCCACVICKSF